MYLNDHFINFAHILFDIKQTMSEINIETHT